MGKFYGIGVGPGEPELVTVKAVRLIGSCDYLFVPQTKSDNLALNIARQYIRSAEIIYLDLPMGEDNSVRYQKAAELIGQTVLPCQSGAFLTLGDPLTYSSFIYLLDHLKTSGLTIETVPGITSYQAAAACLNQPLCRKNETLLICDGLPERNLLDLADTVCQLKAQGAGLQQEYLVAGFEPQLLSRLGLDNEQILDGSQNWPEKQYLSLIYARKTIQNL